MNKALCGIMVGLFLFCMGTICCLADEDAGVPATGAAGNTDFLGFRFGMNKSEFSKMCLSTDGTLAAQEKAIGGTTTWNYWPGEYLLNDELFNKSLFGAFDASDNWNNKEYEEDARKSLPQLLELDQIEIINMDVYRQNASSLGIKPPPMNTSKIQVVFWKSRLLAIRWSSEGQGELTEALKKKYGCSAGKKGGLFELLYLCVNTDRAIKLAGKPGDFCYSYNPDGRYTLVVGYRPLLKEAIDDACKVWNEMKKQQKDQEKQKENQLLDSI